MTQSREESALPVHGIDKKTVATVSKQAVSCGSTSSVATPAFAQEVKEANLSHTLPEVKRTV